MDIHGVNQAVAAFFRNDPYYPRPDSSKEKWEVFRDNYLRVCEHILRHFQIEVLPRTSIELYLLALVL